LFATPKNNGNDRGGDAIEPSGPVHDIRGQNLRGATINPADIQRTLTGRDQFM